jgi:hypothetical protein
MTLRCDRAKYISSMREDVLQSYKSAIATNHRLFNEGDDTATSEYIYPNQMEDAFNIVNMFYQKKCRVISIQKKTKVGADGLMIEIAKLLTTHIDDEFVVNSNNVRILTGMSNAGWEKDMICKAPGCFKDKIFHHGKLTLKQLKKELQNISNSLIIIDEIDTGNKEKSVLHTLLKDSGLLDVKHMEENNNLFVFISATMIKELYDLYRWGDLHELYKMTIPASYIGHKDFLEKKIIKKFYSLNKKENADKWVRKDIIDNYGNDYRVHIVRVNENNVGMVQDACIRKGVLFKNHTSKDRLSPEEISSLFKEPLKQHIVLGIKGLFRRANLIPNSWKLRIGATHELWTKTIDNNVQIQGLPGRMSGYWRDVIEGGHKTGPYRTSREAIEEYENAYENPFGDNDYQCAGLNKKKGKVVAKGTMLAPKNILNLNPVNLPVVEDNSDPSATIPIVINVSEKIFKTIKRICNTWDIDTIHSIIRTSNIDLYNEIIKMDKIQVSQPESDKSYKKYITDFIRKSEQKSKYKILQPEQKNETNKNKDTYQIYLDNRNYNIIVSIYYGSKKLSV